jgi:hypothetical protein
MVLRVNPTYATAENYTFSNDFCSIKPLYGENYDALFPSFSLFHLGL